MGPIPWFSFDFFRFLFNHNETVCQAPVSKRRTGVKRVGKAGRSRRGR